MEQKVGESKMSVTSALSEVEKRISTVRKVWFNNPEMEISEKPHQIRGIRWCILKEMGYFYDSKNNELVKQKKTGIICDEMGLGKTTVIMATWIANFKPGQKTLVVVPPALFNQWATKIREWYGFAPYEFHGYNSKISKNELELIMSSPSKTNHDSATPIVLTTYPMISTRNSPFSKKKNPGKVKKPYHSILWDIDWDRVIYDEAHHLRNAKANKHSGAKLVKSKITWLLTGTPIQNTDKDLLSQFKIMGIYEDMMRCEPDDRIKFIKPYVLQRTKDHLGIDMPSLTSEIVEITEYDSAEEKLMLKYIHSQLNFTNVAINAANVDKHILRYLSGDSPLPMLTRARQACVCPSIIISHLKHIEHEEDIPANIKRMDVTTHTKIRLITENIIQKKSEDVNTLVFCHYVDEMNLISSMLEEAGLDVKMLNGKTTHKQRKIIPTLTPDVLLVQIQSCCEGLNLQQFSNVIFTSPHWNPAVEDQAIARSHRLGQTKPVTVYKYICDGLGDGTCSIDRYCMSVQDAKREKMDDFKKNTMEQISTNERQETKNQETKKQETKNQETKKE